MITPAARFATTVARVTNGGAARSGRHYVWQKVASRRSVPAGTLRSDPRGNRSRRRATAPARFRHDEGRSSSAGVENAHYAAASAFDHFCDVGAGCGSRSATSVSSSFRRSRPRLRVGRNLSASVMALIIKVGGRLAEGRHPLESRLVGFDADRIQRIGVGAGGRAHVGDHR